MSAFGVYSLELFLHVCLLGGRGGWLRYHSLLPSLSTTRFASTFCVEVPADGLNKKPTISGWSSIASYLKQYVVIHGLRFLGYSCSSFGGIDSGMVPLTTCVPLCLSIILSVSVCMCVSLCGVHRDVVSVIRVKCVHHWVSDNDSQVVVTMID